MCEGRFLQVSGLKFAFDPKKTSGSRIDPRLIKVGDAYLDLNKVFLKTFYNNYNFIVIYDLAGHDPI